MENNPIERIKLLMKYDLTKTLNENLDTKSTIIEQRAELVNTLTAATKIEDKIPELARFFNTTEEIVRASYGRNIKDLEKDLKNAINKDIKTGKFFGRGAELGPNAKLVSKQIAIKEILESKTVLTETDIEAIINRVKNLNKQIALGKETTHIARLEAKNAQEAGKVLQDGAKSAENAKIKAVAEEGEKLAKENPKKWSLLNDIKGKLKKKYWYYLGAIPLVGVAAVVWQKLGFGRPDTDLFNNNCIDDLIDDGSATVTYTSGGDPVIYVKSTGNSEYDKMGGLNFFNNGRVVSRDRKKRGYWKCSGEGLSANTQGSNSSREMQVIAELDLEEQVKIDQQLNNDVNAMIRLLDLPVSQNDLKNANTLLTNYANNGKGKEFLQKYEDSGIGPGGMKDSLDYIYTSNPTSVDYKNNLYKIIKQIESGGEETADLGGIQITWDQPGSVTPKPDETKPDKTKQQTYKDCSSVDINTTPLTYGCKDNRISEVQGCIGVAVDGKFGPNTLKALVDNGYEATSGLTKEMYDKIIANCKKGEASTGAVEGGADVNYLRNPIKLDLGPTPELPKFSSKTESGEDFYKRLVTNGNFRAGQIGNDRVKYKGTDLNSEDLAKLNEYVASNGYRLIKNKDKGAQYGGGENDKYVWQKSE